MSGAIPTVWRSSRLNDVVTEFLKLPNGKWIEWQPSGAVYVYSVKSSTPQKIMIARDGLKVELTNDYCFVDGYQLYCGGFENKPTFPSGPAEISRWTSKRLNGSVIAEYFKLPNDRWIEWNPRGDVFTLNLQSFSLGAHKCVILRRSGVLVALSKGKAFVNGLYFYSGDFNPCEVLDRAPNHSYWKASESVTTESTKLPGQQTSARAGDMASQYEFESEVPTAEPTRMPLSPMNVSDQENLANISNISNITNESPFKMVFSPELRGAELYRHKKDKLQPVISKSGSLEFM